MDQQIRNQHTIEFLANERIRLGDVFYVVEKGCGKSYFGKCEVCNGKKELSFNGYTFTCPKCYGSGSQTCVLEVDNYTVNRYRVAGFSEDLHISDWNPAGGFMRQMVVKLFRPRPRGSYSEDNKRIDCTSGYSKGTLVLNLHKSIYSDYKAAVAEADRLNAEQEAIVKKYNDDNGTDFVFEKPKYDPKSR